MSNVLLHHAIGEQELQRLLSARMSDYNLLDSVRPEGPDALRDVMVKLHKALPYTRVAVFAKVYEDDSVLRRLPLVLLVRMRLGRSDGEDDAIEPVRDFTLTIGSLGTDHVGYASFDLRPLRSFDVLAALASHYPQGLSVSDMTLDVNYQLLPFGENQRAVSLLKNADVGLDAIVMRLHVDQAWLLDREPDPSLPAMQNPSIDDWRLSPGSFALAPARLVGEDDCADLYPSDLSSHSFRFHRLVRIGNTIGNREDRQVSGIGYGHVTHYRSDWYPLGHSLGRVLYSLPLAPGEKVNLAIIDWQRQDDAFRDETTSVTEQLQHDTQRDRVVGEIVRASIRERQRGHSLMGGLGASVLAPVGGAIIGGSLGLGGSKRTSQGSRDIVANTIQELNDGFQQSSTAFRELRSTVVTQTSQVEGGRYETRRIANFNHCHTLTVLYYEVLRHYRTSTVFTRRQPVLYVDYNRFRNVTFAEDRVLSYRVVLESGLLDGRYAAGFDALSRKRAAEQRLEEEEQRLLNATEPSPGNWQLTRLVVVLHTGERGHDAPVRINLIRKDGTAVPCRQIQPTPTGDGLNLRTPDHPDFDENSIDTFVVAPDMPVRWQDLNFFQIQFLEPPQLPAMFDSTANWTIDQVEVYASNAAGQTTRLTDLDNPVSLTAPDNVGIPVNSPNAEQVPNGVALTDYVHESDLEAARQLIDHLDEFGAYYSMVMLFGGDPVARQSVLEDTEINNKPLSQLVENRIIDFDGRSLVFPLVAELDETQKRLFGILEEDAQLESGIVAEQLISVPTKGVFADGKQGHCNTCEVIDENRFWDFQKSPIPGDAPQIEPVSTDTRFQVAQDLGSTSLPSNIVNIQNPTDAPDPTGLAAALKVLGTADIFRDMSGGKDLADFLTKTVAGTQSMVTALAGAMGKEKLLEAIDGLESLTPAQKEELAKSVIGAADAAKKPASGSSGGSGGTGGTGAPGGTTGGSTGGATGGSGSSGANSSGRTGGETRPTHPNGLSGGEAPGQTPPTRAVKPERPKEAGIDGFTVRVTHSEFDNVLAATLKNLSGLKPRLVISPSRQTPTASIVLDRNPHEIRMPKGTQRDGYLEYQYSAETEVTVEAVNQETDISAEVSEIEAALPSSFNGSISFGYDLEDGIYAVDVTVSYRTGGKIIEAATFADAFALLLEDVEITDVPSILSVATMSKNDVAEGGTRPWIFHFVENKPTIIRDGEDVLAPKDE